MSVAPSSSSLVHSSSRPSYPTSRFLLIRAVRSGNGVVAMNGNVHLALSTDDGASFKYYDPTTIFPKFAGGLLGDQQIVYVP